MGPTAPTLIGLATLFILGGVFFAPYVVMTEVEEARKMLDVGWQGALYSTKGDVPHVRLVLQEEEGNTHSVSTDHTPSKYGHGVIEYKPSDLTTWDSYGLDGLLWDPTSETFWGRVREVRARRPFTETYIATDEGWGVNPPFPPLDTACLPLIRIPYQGMTAWGSHWRRTGAPLSRGHRIRTLPCSETPSWAQK